MGPWPRVWMHGQVFFVRHLLAHSHSRTMNQEAGVDREIAYEQNMRNNNRKMHMCDEIRPCEQCARMGTPVNTRGIGHYNIERIGNSRIKVHGLDETIETLVSLLSGG